MTAADRMRPPSAAREARLREIQVQARQPARAAVLSEATYAVPPPAPPPPPLPDAAAEAAAQAPFVAEVMQQSRDLEDMMSNFRAALKMRAGPDGQSGISGLARNFKLCDRDGSGSLDLADFAKCVALCKVNLEPARVARLFAAFDRNGSGSIDYEEFLGALRGKMSAMRKALVVAAFQAVDSASKRNGPVTLDDIEDHYDASEHPRVLGGSLSKHAALRALLDGLEGPAAHRGGVVTLDDFVSYYEGVSANIDSDDYFGSMMASVWGRCKLPSGKPAVQFVSSHDVDTLEAILFEHSYRKKGGSHHAQERLLVEAFKQYDANGNGVVDKHEFLRAMERFGLPVRGLRAGIGGLPEGVVFALFDRFDADGSGSLDFREFAEAFLGRHQTSSEPIQYEEYNAPTARELEKAGASAEDLESKLRHPRKKMDHELMAARPISAGGYLSGAVKIHGSSKSAKRHSGAPFR